MSTTAISSPDLLAASTTPPDSDNTDLLLYCAPCQTVLRAVEPDAFPHVLSCGHLVCRLCADAASIMDPALCPVCQTPIEGDALPDVCMAAMGEAMNGGCDADDLTIPRRRHWPRCRGVPNTRSVT